MSKKSAEYLQHLHKDSVIKNDFRPLWNKCEATDPYNIAGIICSDTMISQIKKLIKQKYNEKCTEEVVLSAIHKIINDKMDQTLIKPFKSSRSNNNKTRKVEIVASPESLLTGGEIS